MGVALPATAAIVVIGAYVAVWTHSGILARGQQNVHFDLAQWVASHSLANYH